jgi:hypothetical protein
VKSAILENFAGPPDTGVFSASVQQTIFLTQVSVRIYQLIYGGRCYDHNFLRFSPIFGEKMAFFSKTNVTIHFLHNLALFCVKMPILCRLFWRKYFKNHNIGPWF